MIRASPLDPAPENAIEGLGVFKVNRMGAIGNNGQVRVRDIAPKLLGLCP